MLERRSRWAVPGGAGPVVVASTAAVVVRRGRLVFAPIRMLRQSPQRSCPTTYSLTRLCRIFSMPFLSLLTPYL